MSYGLYWVTDLGYAGTDNVKYATPEQAFAAATAGVKFTKRGREYQSNRDQYGDIYFVKPLR